jgi:hypothetical protein
MKNKKLSLNSSFKKQLSVKNSDSPSASVHDITGHVAVTAVMTKTQIFWEVMPCQLVYSYGITTRNT